MNSTQPLLNPARRKYPAIVWAAVLFLTATTRLLAADVTLSLSGSPIAEAGGVGTVTATLSAPSALTVTVNLAFSGSATLTSDYTRSGTSIVIPPGGSNGTVTLTAMQDAVDG